jgi:hypothetical protein
MQTFLPYASFTVSAAALDNKRLGKQRVETYQIQRVLAGLTKGWKRHPAVLMWENHVPALNAYGRAICEQWIARGFEDSLLPKFQDDRPITMPWWLGVEEFHLSHQSNLVRKDADHYSRIFPGIGPDTPYYWPTHHAVTLAS